MARTTVVGVEISEMYTLQAREGIILLAMDARGNYLLEGYVSKQKMQAEFMRTLLLHFETPQDALARLLAQRGMSARSLRQLGVVYPKDPEVERYYVFVASDTLCLNTQSLLRVDLETLISYIEARVFQRPEDLQALKEFLIK
ncbi:MAG TPA: hypothetical protein GX733_09215 [Tissierellia bacterium]|jgi:hypothetical protein|nr:hypothetical protein [Tissierellia bacterium]